MAAVSNAASRFDPTTASGAAAIATGGLSEVGPVRDAISGAGRAIDQNLLGGAQADAARDGARGFREAGDRFSLLQGETTEQIRQDFLPATNLLGENIGALQGAVNDPSSRVLNNPFFQALSQKQNQDLLASAAARGKVGSGGTDDALIRNQLLLGNQFAQQDIANLQNLTNTGLNAVTNQSGFAQQGTTAQGNIISNVANANAAAGVAGANARAEGTQNLLSTGIGAAATIFSDIRLKENVKFSHVEDGIRMYNWSWTDEALKLVGDQDTTGPIAQELKKTHPEKVVMDEETGFYKVLM